ncbi:hypothetical protein [Actinomyces qiguomingii]|uniref:hypothetical protein n=1 Tax=Actinomyces qiguomingii TaxID=2057800 RepID=UPI000FFE3F7D|nr:hypothetical protein [Actinomyces qiguomingii]
MCHQCRRVQHAAEAAESVARASGSVPRSAGLSLRRLAGLETDAMVASPSLGREVTWLWRMLPGDMSMVQQEIECLADLADQLRREGLVAMSRPRRNVRHGTGATILLTLTVRPATEAEARVLGHEPRSAQPDQTEAVGVAA